MAVIAVVAIVTVVGTPGTAETPFPGDLPPENLEGQLADVCPDPDFESSGAVWHPLFDALFVVSDDGKLARIEADGNVQDCVSISGLPDLEAVCLAAENSPLIFLGVEHEDAIFVYDPTDPCDGPAQRTPSPDACPTFKLTSILKSEKDNKGLEALTFIPVPGHPEGGLFVAGLQENGRLYVLDIPLSSGGSQTATLVNVLAPVPLLTDIAGLHYDRESDRLYAIHDTDDVMLVLRPDGTLTGCHQLPGTGQEGVAMEACNLYIADDDTGEVLRYTGFPSASPDSDGDGVTDCADDCAATASGATVNSTGCACDQTAPVVCGNGICETGGGESCHNCEDDCNSKQTGNPGNQFCCGDDVGCEDRRCTDSGFDCGEASCCGDFLCGANESPCSCSFDCGSPAAMESCANGEDDDCDGLTDCVDPDCCTDAACGNDNDGDGYGACDCDDNDAGSWLPPGKVELTWQTRELLAWDPPVEPGGLTPVYDVLRAESPVGFLGATCVESDYGANTQAIVVLNPPSSSVHFYLVRADNACVTAGLLGSNSQGKVRFGRLCP